jgi:hypothetical protein
MTSKNFNPHGGDGYKFWVGSLTPEQRIEIYDYTGDLEGWEGSAYANAHLLALSALGTSMDVEGTWTPPAALESWHHVTSQGRDQYVKVVQRGYLFPLGHRAVLIDIVQRVFVPDDNNSTDLIVQDAYLQYEQFIRVVQPTKTYPATDQPFGGRGWPFASVTITRDTTPPLDPANYFTKGLPPLTSFMPSIGGTPLAWPVAAVDNNGNHVSFSVPLLYVEGVKIPTGSTGTKSQYDETWTRVLAHYYNSGKGNEKVKLPSRDKTAEVGGTNVRFADEAPGHAGGTTHPTLSIELAAATPGFDPNVPKPPAPSSSKSKALMAVDQPAFYPSLSRATIRLLAAEALAQKPVDDSAGSGIRISLYDGYLTGNDNKGQVYARTVDEVPLLMPTNSVGAVASPNSRIVGLGQSAGVIGAAGSSHLASYASKRKLNIADYFGNVVSQVLGGLPLAPIPKSEFSGGGFLHGFANADGLPVVTHEIDPSTGIRTVTYTLVADLNPDFPNGIISYPASGPGQMRLTAVTTSDPATGTSSYSVNGSIDPFIVNVFGDGSLELISVPFNSVQFTSQNGSKPNVNCQIGSVTFQGDLAFLNALEQFLQNLGGSGFSISVSPAGIDASFSITLPPIGVGVVNIQGLGLSAGVNIPFLSGSMLATFGFATIENPFIVTVMCFGGGGSFLIGVGLGGVQSVQISIDFCGQFALNLGVASGSVSLTAGLTYSYSATAGTTLTAFVKISGEVEVLGIISISLEVDISLTYQSSSGQSSLTGTATLQVEISIFCFGITVGITVQKTFAGSSSSGAEPLITDAHGTLAPPAWPTPYPAFGDSLTDAEWSTYCSCFAG